MGKYKVVPNIRFEGFDAEWERSELKRIAKIVGGGTPDTNNSNYWNGNINWFSPNEIGKYPYVYSSYKKITNLGLKKSSAKLHPSEKTILFTSRAGIGDMAILKTEAATNQGFQSLELKDNIYPYFVYSYGFKIKKEAYKLASGSTFLEISKKDMEKINLWFPAKKEQEKIGNFFAKLDKLFDLQQQKIDKLELLKKTLLQKLFPKHDAKIPELRFKGYEGNWKKHKLKELASFLKGKGYSKNDIVHYGFPIILYGRMYTNYRLNIKFIDDTFVKDDKNSVKSVEGDVIIPASGETAEEISIASNIKRSGIIIGGDLNIIRPDNKLIDSSFLALVLSNGKVKQQIAKRAQGKSIVHIHNTDLMPLEIDFPSLNEQQKIGNLLSKVDQLIELENKKLEDLQQFKKCLLQNMFVD